MKTGPDDVGTAENEYGDANTENGTRRPPFCRKRVRERKNLKTGPDALATTENEYGNAKHENGTQRPRNP
jgi:hypothetical protein